MLGWGEASLVFMDFLWVVDRWVAVATMFFVPKKSKNKNVHLLHIVEKWQPAWNEKNLSEQFNLVKYPHRFLIPTSQMEQV